MKPHYVYRSFTRCDPGPYNPPGSRYFARVFSTGGFFMVTHKEQLQPNRREQIANDIADQTGWK